MQRDDPTWRATPLQRNSRIDPASQPLGQGSREISRKAALLKANRFWTTGKEQEAVSVGSRVRQGRIGRSETSFMAKQSEICVVVPAFNEGRMIGRVLLDVTALPYQVVVVDDGSSDDTTAQALAFPVTVLRHVCNLGQGAALQTGINFACRQLQAKFLVTFDADGQHRAVDIERLLQPLRRGEYDIVLGSRFLPEGSATGISWGRRVILRLGAILIRIVTGLALTDTHNGLRALTAETASKLKLTENGMAHASEILSAIARLRLRYCELPVTVTYTGYSVAKGQSGLNSLNIVWDMIRMKLR
jgi:polyprenyl-phospho-N-acetylgalactosaminyl synthase